MGVKVTVKFTCDNCGRTTHQESEEMNMQHYGYSGESLETVKWGLPSDWQLRESRDWEIRCLKCVEEEEDNTPETLNHD